MNSLVKNLISAINKLKTNQVPLKQNYLSEQVLQIVFQIGRSGLEVTKEDSAVIGPLIEEIIPSLEHCIFDLGLSFDSDRGQYNLILRSGVQFLLDNFKGFQAASDKVLADSLKYIKDSESLQTLDDELATWKNDPVVSLESVPHSTADLVRPVGVPESHNWWS